MPVINTHLVDEEEFVLFVDYILWFFRLRESPRKNVLLPKRERLLRISSKKQVETNDKKRLSDYGFFKGKLANLSPNEKVYSYSINTPLFSNYAEKARFIYLPSGKKMALELHGPVRFDDGAVLIKNFYYPVDQTSPNDERELLETRLLIKKKKGGNP